jgi:peptidyl-prolyl cis-trans isomerase C
MTKERRQQAVEDQIDSLLENVTVRTNPSVVNAGLSG